MTLPKPQTEPAQLSQPKHTIALEGVLFSFIKVTGNQYIMSTEYFVTSVKETGQDIYVIDVLVTTAGGTTLAVTFDSIHGSLFTALMEAVKLTSTVTKKVLADIEKIKQAISPYALAHNTGREYSIGYSLPEVKDAN